MYSLASKLDLPTYRGSAVLEKPENLDTLVVTKCGTGRDSGGTSREILKHGTGLFLLSWSYVSTEILSGGRRKEIQK